MVRLSALGGVRLAARGPVCLAVGCGLQAASGRPAARPYGVSAAGWLPLLVCWPLST